MTDPEATNWSTFDLSLGCATLIITLGYALGVMIVITLLLYMLSDDQIAATLAGVAFGFTTTPAVLVKLVYWVPVRFHRAKIVPMTPEEQAVTRRKLIRGLVIANLFLGVQLGVVALGPQFKGMPPIENRALAAAFAFGAMSLGTYLTYRTLLRVTREKLVSIDAPDEPETSASGA